MSRIAIVGVEGSGKTVLMAALAECYKKTDSGAPFLFPENQAAYMFTERSTHLLSNKKWPDATSMTSMKYLHWTLRQEDAVLQNIDMLDYPGELYRLAFGERDEEAIRAHQKQLDEFLSHLTDADTLMVLLNIADVENPGASTRNAEAIWITRGIFEFSQKLKKLQRRVLVFTQADRYPELAASPEALRQIYTDRLPMMKVLFPDLELMAVSVAGMDEQGNPVGHFSQEGCHKLMRYLLSEQLEALQWTLDRTLEMRNEVLKFDFEDENVALRHLNELNDRIKRLAKRFNTVESFCDVDVNEVVGKLTAEWVQRYAPLMKELQRISALGYKEKANPQTWEPVWEWFGEVRGQRLCKFYAHVRCILLGASVLTLGLFMCFIIAIFYETCQ